MLHNDLLHIQESIRSVGEGLVLQGQQLQPTINFARQQQRLAKFVIKRRARKLTPRLVMDGEK